MTDIHGGLAARLQLSCLLIAGLVAERIDYRGMQRIAHLLGGHSFTRGNNVVVQLDSSTRLRVYLKDGYWVSLLLPGFEYEPDIASVLRRVLAEPGVFFIDCGANIGYWSVVASGLIDAPDRVLAIEASPPLFERLVDNAHLNGDRFRCLLAAVWSKDDETLTIIGHDQRHAGSSVVGRRDKLGRPGYYVNEVRSLTLDSICESYVDDAARVVLKLDVEEAEIPALQGAKVLLARRPLLVYEDHGNDPESRVSIFILEQLGLDVYWCGERESVRRMPSVAAIRDVKTSAGKGYNFFACAADSPFAGVMRSLAAH